MKADTISIGEKKISVWTVVAIGLVAMLTLIAGMAFKVAPAKAQVSTNAKNLAGLIAVDSVTGGGGAFGASTTAMGTENLGDLIVLQGLFPTSSSSTQNAKDLAALIAVDNTVSGGANGAFTNTTNLGGLIVLNSLFLDP